MEKDCLDTADRAENQRAPQALNWFHVYPNVCLALGCCSLLLLLRSVLLTIVTSMGYSYMPRFRAIYLRNDLLLTAGWAILCSLFLLTHRRLKQRKKSALLLVYLGNIGIPLLLVLYLLLTNHLYYTLLEQGFYHQHFETLGVLDSPHKFLSHTQIVKNKLQHDAWIRGVRVGFFMLACGVPLTMNSLYFKRRKAYLLGSPDSEAEHGEE